MAALINWELAASTAKRLSPAPPPTDRAAADAVVTQLYELAEVAAAHVAEIT